MSRYSRFPYDGDSALVGRVLRGAEISSSRPTKEVDDWRDDVLTLTTDAAPVVWDVEGDCCSDSRFTDLKLDAILGKRITEVRQVESIVDPALDPTTLRRFAEYQHDKDYNELPPPEGFERAPQESEQIYGVRIVAEDGSVGFVIHRNWSNGYYGGMLSERGSAGAP